MVLFVMSHDGDRRVGGKTSKREMPSRSSLSDLQKLVKVTSTSASLSYVDDSGDVITIENDEGHQFPFQDIGVHHSSKNVVVDWRLFVKYAPKPYKITITDTASSIASSSSSSVAANSRGFSKAGSSSGNGGSLNDLSKWSHLALLFLFIGQLVPS